MNRNIAKNHLFTINRASSPASRFNHINMCLPELQSTTISTRNEPSYTYICLVISFLAFVALFFVFLANSQCCHISHTHLYRISVVRSDWPMQYVYFTIVSVVTPSPRVFKHFVSETEQYFWLFHALDIRLEQ